MAGKQNSNAVKEIIILLKSKNGNTRMGTKNG